MFTTISFFAAGGERLASALLQNQAAEPALMHAWNSEDMHTPEEYRLAERDPTIQTDLERSLPGRYHYGVEPPMKSLLQQIIEATSRLYGKVAEQ